MTMAITSPYYLSIYHYNSIEIGLVLFISLAATTLFVLFFYRVKFDINIRAYILGLLLITGFIVLIISPNPIVYILAIVVGGISLSGRDLSAYQPIEQYSISHYVTDQKEKNKSYSIYNFGSYGASSVGSLLLYLWVDPSFKLFFTLNLILSIGQLLLFLGIKFPKYEKKAELSEISPDMKGKIRTLTALFSLDALGGGLVTTSLLTLWFKSVYNIDLSTAGFIFLFVNVLTAISILISNRIQNRIGLIKTMVFTHLISNGFLVLMPLFHSLTWSMSFLFLKQTTSQMDVPARDSFINTYIPKHSRIKSNSTFTSARSASLMPGPILGGLAVELFPPSMLFAAGGIKILYDLLLYRKFSFFKD
jgi:predicted MFS family arabinose efflux permease